MAAEARLASGLRVRDTLFDVVAQRFDERLERHPQLLIAVTAEHHRTGTMRRARELGSEPRLPNPRLTGDEHDPMRPGSGFLPVLLYRRQLDVAACESELLVARQEWWQRQANGRRLREWLPLHHARRDGLR